MNKRVLHMDTRFWFRLQLAAGLAFCLLLVACSDGNPQRTSSTAETAQAAGKLIHQLKAVNGERILAANSEPGNWLSHGRSYDEQRHSPLTNIDESNIGRLGLEWSYDFATRRGMEATPLVIDGAIYASGAWSRVYAWDAKTGELLWEYNPKVPGSAASNACCDAVNRGVAAWGDKLYLGTLDGRLVALDRETGAEVWSVQTTPADQTYTITGAPRVLKGKVIIGNGGADLGVRGYVSAYDAETGNIIWRFYTVPGNPADGFENNAIRMAAETWKGGEWWKRGGGGTVWDSMAYDADLDLLYVGVGNGSPWSRRLRSPGGGDNLFLSSIVALKPDTGEYVWHYQTSPGDSWDYTATQHMILADLKIDGLVRKVIMQAPKNGFFYVLDRETGEFLSAEPFVTVTWATHIDPETGRAAVKPESYYADKVVLQSPSPFGAHNWQPMSYSPDTGLVYIPAMDIGFPYKLEEGFEFRKQGPNVGADGVASAWPEDPAVRKQIRDSLKGLLIAWDPVAQKQAWALQHKTAWNGGMLTTASGLLFQGNGEGELVAYRAVDGKRLWGFNAQTGIVAPPISYEIDGRQYIAIMAGWGGALPNIQGGAVTKAANRNISRLLVFSLDGKRTLALPTPVERVLDPPDNKGTLEEIRKGRQLFHRSCFMCHGDTAVSGGVIADLRYSSKGTHKVWDDIVLGGALSDIGMASFADDLSAQDSKAIQAYIIKRAHDALAEQQGRK